MLFKKLGNTNISVSTLCLGTMNWGYQNTELEAHEQLDYALSRWINFIDTAEVYPVPPDAKTYGLTETYIGNWIQKRGKRNDIILATKVVGWWTDWIRWGSGLTVTDIKEAVTGSLKRLQTEYIDLYQIHWPRREVNKFGKMNYHESMFTSKDQEEQHILEVLQTFQKLQKEGKIKHLGLSNDTPWGVMKFLELARKHNLPEIQTIQNPYNLLQRQSEVGLSEICLLENIWLLAYSPLAGGILTGKYLDNMMPDGSRYALRWRKRYAHNFNHRTMKATENYQKIAKKLGISVTQLALAWVQNHQFVCSTIIWATSVTQLKENIDSTQIILSKEVKDEIDNIFSQNPNPATF